jgi:DMSO/TMAO reductase YedYZ molybdopterin-dependent catalytic subunit
VPGWYAMASVKWLSRVSIEDRPSESPFMARDYRFVYPTAERVVTAPVEELLVKSLVTHPRAGETIPGDVVRIAGLAWGGVPPLRKVEVSVDQGRHWTEATLLDEASGHAWRRWEAIVPVDAPGRVRVLARAVDARGVSQPRRAAFNASGYGNNAMHEVAFEVVPRA